MIKQTIKFLLGVLMIPVAIAATASFYGNMLLIADLASSSRFFMWGVVTYVVLHIFFYKPTYIYVFGHEAIHAVTSWVFGGSIKSFKVSEKGGKVATDKTNFVVELSPYFIPVYALVILCVYFVVSASYNISSSTFMFLIGMALAFHLVSTIEILKVKQPDMMKSGYVFSIVLVYILNVIVISVVFSVLFPGFGIANYFKALYTSSIGVYRAIIKQLFF